MSGRAFLVWSVMMGAGIALSARAALSPGVCLAACLAALPLLCALHRLRPGAAFFPVSCVFFLLLGFARGCQGDVSLLPSGVCAFASRLSLLAHARLHSVGLSPGVACLLDAMLLGRRGGLSPGLRGLYAGVGASHVLALSGLHLCVLSGVLCGCLFRALTLAPLRRALACLTLALVWCYALLAGLPVSLVRAAVMMSLFLVSLMRLGGGAEGWHALGVAAVAVLFVSPGSLWNVGFQLSFAAVAGLLALYVPICGLADVRVASFRWLWCGVAASAAAQVACFPLVALHFGRLSAWGLLFGPVFVFLAGLILLCALPALALGGAACLPVSFFVGVQHALMSVVSSLPGGAGWCLHASWARVCALYAAVFCFAPAVSAAGAGGGEGRTRLARLLRRWPSLAAGAACLLAACRMEGGSG